MFERTVIKEVVRDPQTHRIVRVVETVVERQVPAAESDDATYLTPEECGDGPLYLTESDVREGD